MWNDGPVVRMHNAYGVGWTLMLLLVVLVAIGLAVMVVLLLRGAAPAPPTTPTRPTWSSKSEALQILDHRFAAGEIDEEEFLRRRSALTDTPTT